MLNVRNVTLNVAAVIVIVAGLLSLLTTLPQTLLGLSAAPAPQATTASASITATTEISAANTTTPTVKPIPPRAGPNPLIIRGEKGPLFPLFQTNWDDVHYATAPLVVWSIDPTTLAPTDTLTNFVVSWLPAAGSVNTLLLDVEPGGSACDNLVNTQPTRSSLCYTVSTTHRINTLPTGEYTSTLYISDGVNTESSLLVKVLVGRPISSLVAIVALGVILTELWLQWRRSWQYQLGWAYRRRQWIEWLGSNFTWLKPFKESEADEAMRSALRRIQAELRAQVKTVSDWLAEGQSGKSTMSDLAERLATLPSLIDPIRLAGLRYLKPEAVPPKWTEAVDSLTDKIRSVIEAASSQAETERDNAKKALDGVYNSNYPLIDGAYKKLNDVWTGPTPPADATLLAAWETAQVIWKKLGELKTLAEALQAAPDPKDATDVANRVSQLSSHLDSLSQEVAEKAKSQLDAVNKVSPGTGLLETQNFLKAAAIDLSVVKRMSLRAQHPLQFISAANAAVNDLHTKLDELNTCADGLHVDQLSTDAVANQLLGSLHTALGNVDTKLGDPKTDQSAYWNELLLIYQGQERVISLGTEIGDLLAHSEDLGDNLETEKKYIKLQLRLAYKHLLDNQLLDAEISIKRARLTITHAELQPAAKSKAKDQVGEGVTAEARKGAEREPGEPEKRPGANRWKWAAGLAGLFGLVEFAIVIGLLILLNASNQISLMSLSIGSDNPRAPDEPTAASQSNTLLIIVLLVMGVLILAALIALVKLWKSPTRHERWQSARLAWHKRWQSIRLIFSEALDISLPQVAHFIMWLGSLLLSLAIAVTIIIAAQEVVLKNSLLTWGNTLDLIVAFTWGAVAHRLLQSLQSSWSGVQSFIQGDKTAADTAKPAEGK